MKKEDGKKGLGLFKLLSSKKQGSCCGNFELEELPEERINKAANKDQKNPAPSDRHSSK